MSKSRYEYVELSLTEVIKEYSGEFAPNPDNPEASELKVYAVTWIIDPFMNIVLFKTSSANADGSKQRVDWIESGVKSMVSYLADKRFGLRKAPDAAWRKNGVWTTGEEIVMVSWYIDPVKDKVVYRLLLEEAKPKETA